MPRIYSVSVRRPKYTISPKSKSVADTSFTKNHQLSTFVVGFIAVDIEVQKDSEYLYARWDGPSCRYVISFMCPHDEAPPLETKTILFLRENLGREGFEIPEGCNFLGITSDLKAGMVMMFSKELKANVLSYCISYW